MHSIGKLGTGQESYYLEKVAEGAEDYYSGEGEAEGYWVGSVPPLLGLDGKVDGEQLTAMLTGVNPATGEPLGLRAVGGRGPVPGFDLTFSAPKSVSLTWALGGHPDTLVTLTFRAKDGGTELILTHSGLTSEESRSDHGKGWNSALNKLARYVRGETP